MLKPIGMLAAALSALLATPLLAAGVGETTSSCCQTPPGWCDELAACDEGCPALVESAGCEAGGCAECCDDFHGRRRLLGLFLPSDHCFDRFISPLSNPFFFEDPRSLTEVRGIFLDNALPQQLGPGDVRYWAGQVRGRLTDRLSFIAPRLGYMQINVGDGGDGRSNPNGFASAPVGLKYNLIRDVDRQFLVSGGVTYFIPGSKNIYQGYGNGDFHFFLTGGKEILGRGHYLTGTGFRIPSDSRFGSQLWYWSHQVDYELPGHLYPLLGLNWFHYMRSANLGFGDGGPAGFGALDLVNLPARSIAGTNVVSALVGARWKPSRHVELGGGWEFPLTQRTDVLQNRVYADVIFRY